MMFSEKQTTRPARSGRLLVVLMAALSVAVALLMAIAADAEAKKNHQKPPTTDKPAPNPTNCNRAGSGDSVVKAWGANWNGQLGDGTETQRTTPVQVQNLGAVQTIAGGGGHSLALKEDCTVWGWGANFNGQLGDGTFTPRNTPVQVKDLGGVKAIAADFEHSLALKTDGTVWAWGYNGQGQLGDGTSGTDRNTPVQVKNLSRVKAIAAGGNHSLALKEDGTVFAWGYNSHGQVGDGTSGTDRTAPVQVKNLSGVKAIDAGGRHNLALKTDGTVWAWGNNLGGQLGNGTFGGETPNPTPIQVKGELPTNAPPGNSQAFLPWNYLSGVKAISAGSYHSVALKDDGTLRSWGTNWAGQLGDGTTTSRKTPVKVQNLSGVEAIAGGTLSHSLALKGDGTVWAWGQNDEGQLGDGTSGTDRTPPVQVQNLSGVTSIAAGGSHSLAKVEKPPVAQP